MNETPCKIVNARTMICFTVGTQRFNHRVAAIIIHDGRVLIHRRVQDDFWALPGGRIELGESSCRSLQREMREELGVDVTVERLLWIMENFFDFDDLAFHEVAMYYLVSLPEDAAILAADRMAGMEDDCPLVFEWFPIDALEDVPLYPQVLRTALRKLPATTQHLSLVEVERT